MYLPRCGLFGKSLQVVCNNPQESIEEMLTLGLRMPEQIGAERGRHIGEHVQIIQSLINSANRKKRKFMIWFIDLSKAFDSVTMATLDKTLVECEIPTHLAEAIREIYQDRMIRVWTPAGYTRYFKVQEGVRQGCPLSPLLFVLVMNYVTRQIKEKLKGYRYSQKTTLKFLAYADDLVIFAETEENLIFNMKLI